MIKIATSILSASNRITAIEDLNNTDSDYIHIDVMDNIFVPNYQLPIEEVNELGTYSLKPFDIHLMVEDPEPFINNLLIDNTYAITVHLEIKKDLKQLIKIIKEHGFKAGLAIKPNTNINELYQYLDDIDKVIVMSVEPGFGGQSFMPSAIDMIKTIRKKKPDIVIEVDGGINDETINYIKDIADIAVVGSYIIKQSDYNKAINNLKN